jgi:hypothetical protein
VPELELETSVHSGSVTLPAPQEGLVAGAANLFGSLPRGSSVITDPVSLSTHTGLNSTSMDSKEFEDWEEAGSVPPASRQTTSVQGSVSNRNPSGVVDWIMLDDD